MKIFYIDVYFLINFSIDALALYFSIIAMHISTSNIRLYLSAFMAAMYAVFCVFTGSSILKILLGIAFSLLIIALFANDLSLYRRLKAFSLFIIFETLIGGIVFYAFSILDQYIVETISTDGIGENRRELLVLSIIILLSFGVFKLYMSLFSSDSNAKSVKMMVKIGENEYVFDAFVDTGNLAFDPIDMAPITLVNMKLSNKVFPSYLKYEDISSISTDEKRRIRLIPITQGGNRRMLVGVRPDEVYILVNSSKERVKTILAIEKSEGTYGGFDALVPSSVIKDVL